MPLPDSFAPSHGWLSSWLLPIVAVVLLVVDVGVRRASGRGSIDVGRARVIERATRVLLVISAFVAVLSYVDYGRFRYGTYLNEWDVYHYYVNTRFAPELGYDGLYEATLIADRESGSLYRNPHHSIRDLTTYELVDVDRVFARESEIRRRFSPQRWADFVRTIRWFARQLPPERFSLLLEDHGYNGTPAWTFVVGSALTRHLDITRAPDRVFLLSIDPLLLLALVAGIRRAFGGRVAALVVILIGTHYLLSWGHLKGALLRTDFGVSAALAVCAARYGRPGLAGALLGWATLSRAFPGALVLGPFVQAILPSAGGTRRRDALHLMVAFVLVVSVGILGSIAYFGGIAPWIEWAKKIALHTSAVSDWNIGYRTLLDVHFVDGVPQAIDVAERLREEPELAWLHRLTLLATRAAVLLPSVVFMRRMPLDRAIAFGFVFVFFLADPAYYYYLVVVVAFLYFASHLDDTVGVVGVSCVLLGGAFGYVLFAGVPGSASEVVMLRGWKQQFPTYYFMGWVMNLTSLLMIGVAARDARAKSADKPRAVV